MVLGSQMACISMGNRKAVSGVESNWNASLFPHQAPAGIFLNFTSFMTSRFLTLILISLPINHGPVVTASTFMHADARRGPLPAGSNSWVPQPAMQKLESIWLPRPE